jgi:hypothetical protein
MCIRSIIISGIGSPNGIEISEVSANHIDKLISLRSLDQIRLMKVWAIASDWYICQRLSPYLGFVQRCIEVNHRVYHNKRMNYLVVVLRAMKA